MIRRNGDADARVAATVGRSGLRENDERFRTRNQERQRLGERYGQAAAEEEDCVEDARIVVRRCDRRVSRIGEDATAVTTAVSVGVVTGIIQSLYRLFFLLPTLCHSFFRSFVSAFARLTTFTG